MKELLGNLRILWPLWIFALKLSQAFISSNFAPVTIIIPFKHIHQLSMEFSQESENPYNTSSGPESILLFRISDVIWYAEWVEMSWFCYWYPTFTLMNFWWQNDTKQDLAKARWCQRPCKILFCKKQKRNFGLQNKLGKMVRIIQVNSFVNKQGKIGNARSNKLLIEDKNLVLRFKFWNLASKA